MMNRAQFSERRFTRAALNAALLLSTAFLQIADTQLLAQSRKASSAPAPSTPTSPPPPLATQPAQPALTVSAQLSIDPKAEQILQRAVEALGGNNYLNIRSAIGRGLFTPFKEGVSGDPSSFVDYMVFPDRERTEFRSASGRVIQTNIGDKGWYFDSATRSIKDLKRDQIEEFQLAMRTSVDNLLRGVWRKESGAKLAYVGRREAGLAKRNETVRLIYPDEFSVEFEFGAKDFLPAKSIYMRKDSDGKEATEEDRFAQYISTGGILAPFIIDHYRAAVQMSRINYRSLEFNAPIADELFSKPVNLKALK